MREVPSPSSVARRRTSAFGLRMRARIGTEIALPFVSVNDHSASAGDAIAGSSLRSSGLETLGYLERSEGAAKIPRLSEYTRRAVRPLSGTSSSK